MNKKQQMSLKKIYSVVGTLYDELGKFIQENCDLDDSIKMNNDLSLALTITSPEKQILNLLHELKIPSHLTGYRYICDALLYLFEIDEYTYIPVTQKLYPKIAQKYNKTNSSQIERAIRNAIESAFKNNSAKLQELFPTQTQIRKKATNSEFLYRILEYIKKGI